MSRTPPLTQSTSAATPTFGASILGETEKALNAILDRELTGTGLSEHRWITLSLALVTGEPVDRDALAGRVAAGVKVTEAQAQARIAELAAAHLVEIRDDEQVEVTDAGRELHARIRTAIVPITVRLWGDLPAEDLAAAGRVLSTVLERANGELG
jgi:hypothetical protein